MKLNTTAITNAIIAALTHGDAFEAEMLKLQGLLKGTEREAVKDIVAPVVAAHYGETFADGKWADSKCAAKRKANRIIASIVGTAPKQANKVKVNKALVKQMAALLKGMDAKAVNATLTAVRAAL
jgi:Asp-tRNA(Asn)/Glu-tRNA(Gln) amidotransferase B subunit